MSQTIQIYSKTVKYIAENNSVKSKILLYNFSSNVLDTDQIKKIVKKPILKVNCLECYSYKSKLHYQIIEVILSDYGNP